MFSGDSTFDWREWTLGSLSLGNLAAPSRPGTLASYSNPVTGASLSGITGWNASKGVGRILANYADGSSHEFVRGGNWSYFSYTGVLALILNTPLSYTTTAIGFRVPSRWSPSSKVTPDDQRDAEPPSHCTARDRQDRLQCLR